MSCSNVEYIQQNGFDFLPFSVRNKVINNETENIEMTNIESLICQPVFTHSKKMLLQIKHKNPVLCLAQAS